MTRERIEDMREVVLPFVKKRLLEINYEGLGESDAEEFARDFNEILNLAIKALEQESIIDKIRAEIMDCLKALDDIEKSDFNIYLPNYSYEMAGRRLTYQQCLEFIDKYKAESEDNK